MAASGKLITTADIVDGTIGIGDLASGTVVALEACPITINGNFDVFSRSIGTVTSTTTYNRITSFAADRIFVKPAGASITQARSTTVPDTKSAASLLITGAASVTTVDVCQRVRSQLALDACRQSLVFSCFVQNTTGGAFTPNLRIGTPGGTDVFTTVTNRLDQALQSCADGAWTRVSHVFDPSLYTNLGAGMEIALRIPSGSLTAGKTVRVAQFDLRPGSTLTTYVPPELHAERAACLQYCEIIGGVDVFEPACSGYATSTTAAYALLFFVPKWKVPTISVSAAADWALTNPAGSANIACSALAFSNATNRSALAPNSITVASGLTAGQSTHLVANNSAVSRISLVAELDE